jgi:hypothetical protein
VWLLPALYEQLVIENIARFIFAGKGMSQTEAYSVIILLIKDAGRKETLN